MQNALHIFIFNVQWMGWNTILAVLPYLLSLILFERKRKVNVVWLLGFILFFLFLPNAPYVITDVIHLYRSSANINSFVTLLMIVFQYIVFILLGLYCFVESYRKMESFIASWYSIAPVVVRIPSFIAISIGVYLGRVVRLNSWDAFFNPTGVLSSLVYLQTADALVYVVMFAGFLFGIYFLYMHVKR